MLKRCLQNRNRLPDMKKRLVVAEGEEGLGWTGTLGLIDATIASGVDEQ